MFKQKYIYPGVYKNGIQGGGVTCNRCSEGHENVLGGRGHVIECVD